MSALRIATPDGIRFVDLGPAAPAPLRGFRHRPHGIPGGSFCRPLPTTPDGRPLTPELRKRWREEKRSAARKAGAV